MSSRTALNVGVILVRFWCNILCDDTHDVHEIARKHTVNARYHTISNGIAKTRIDNFDLWSKLAKNTLQSRVFFVISSRTTMIALRQVMSYDWLRQVMCDCVALMGCGQSYHNYAKRIITFAKQTHNPKLKPSHLQIIQSQDG